MTTRRSIVIVLGQKLFQLFRHEPALLRRVAHPVHDPFTFSDGFFARHQRDGHRDLGTAALLRRSLSDYFLNKGAEKGTLTKVGGYIAIRPLWRIIELYQPKTTT